MASGPPPRDLSDETLSEIIGSHTFGTLATLRRSGHPHLTTMIYSWDPVERIVRFFTTTDRVKVAQLRRNPHAALHVSGPDVWSFAVAEGEAEISAISTEPGDATGREIWGMLPDDMRPADQAAFFRSMVDERRVVIRLRVDKLYGTVLEQ